MLLKKLLFFAVISFIFITNVIGQIRIIEINLIGQDHYFNEKSSRNQIIGNTIIQYDSCGKKHLSLINQNNELKWGYAGKAYLALPGNTKALFGPVYRKSSYNRKGYEYKEYLVGLKITDSGINDFNAVFAFNANTQLSPSFWWYGETELMPFGYWKKLDTKQYVKLPLFSQLNLEPSIGIEAGLHNRNRSWHFGINSEFNSLKQNYYLSYGIGFQLTISDQKIFGVGMENGANLGFVWLLNSNIGLIRLEIFDISNIK